MKSRILQIEKVLTTDFEKELFAASVSYINKTTDPLRFNSFAFSMRELFRHVLSKLAPDSEVMECAWFKPETPTGNPSRKQKIIYAIRGGLGVEFVTDELGYDFKDELKEIINSIKLLSKYTHVNEKTFNLSQIQCEEYAEKVADSFLSIFALISLVSSELKFFLHDHIGDELLSIFIENIFSDLDILSSQTFAESSEIESFEIEAITHNCIQMTGEGYVEISLNYGPSRDSVEFNSSFPFDFKCVSCVKDPTDLILQKEDISVDTTGWDE